MIKFHGKSIFYVLYKKDKKKLSRANSYLSTEFCLFYLAHMKSRFFVKQLGSCIGREDIHATYCLNFLDIQNMFKLYLKQRKHMHPRAKMPRPLNSSYLRSIARH
jgi:hypothetical protein